jgi:subtilase family serine protease
MQRNMIRNLVLVIVTLVLILVPLIFGQSLAHAYGQQRMTLYSQSSPLLPYAHMLQSADPQQSIDLSIGLRMRNEAAADALLQAQRDPRSIHFQQYLSPQQYLDRFAPTTTQVQQVGAYLQSQGFQITTIAPDNLLIEATGTVAQAQQAFQTHIDLYRLKTMTFHANVSAPTVPAYLSPLINSIGGLDDSIRYQPRYQGLADSSPLIPHGRLSYDDAPAGFGPVELASAYDMAPLQNAGFRGENQSIALFELDGFRQSDVDQYFQQYGLGSPKITTIPVNHFNGTAGQGAIEVELDLEVVGALAPQANMLVYEGPGTVAGINATYNEIVSDHKARIVVISWGLCEASTGNAELQTLDTIFKSGALQGMIFVAAAGDAGAYDCHDTRLAVDSPADDPYVTGVGATNLQLNAGSYGGESVWSDGTTHVPGPLGAGSGGGVSATFKMPDWQNGPGVQNTYSNGNRQVPDVTAVGDPTTGYSIYCTVTRASCSTSGWMITGGTSAAAPLWAAGLLLTDQYLQAQNRRLPGQMNAQLYKLFNTRQPYSPFHDITQGNNLYYPATTGYDLASGIGSPDMYNIAQDLAASAP